MKADPFQVRVNLVGCRRPHRGVAQQERLELGRGQLIPLRTQLRQSLTRSLEKAVPQILVCQKPADDELHCLVRHASLLSQAARQPKCA